MIIWACAGILSTHVDTTYHAHSLCDRGSELGDCFKYRLFVAGWGPLHNLPDRLLDFARRDANTAFAAQGAVAANRSPCPVS